MVCGSDLYPEYIVYALVTDHLGSVRFVVNLATGNVSQKITYDEYGNVHTNTGQDITPFFFAGGLYEEATGLTRFGARDYDAGTGRWTAKDPILFAGGQTNLLAYCNNDPISFIDPEGLGSWGVRKLDGVPWRPIRVFPITQIADLFNLEVLHEHYWFDDGRNFGFFDDKEGLKGGVRPDIYSQDKYKMRGEYFDDSIMEIAIKNINWSSKVYGLFGNTFSSSKKNCQDWARAVRSEYYRLKKERDNNPCN